MINPLAGGGIAVGAFADAARQAKLDEEQRKLDAANIAATTAGTQYQQAQTQELQRQAALMGRNYGFDPKVLAKMKDPAQREQYLEGIAASSGMAGDPRAQQMQAVAAGAALGTERIAAAGLSTAKTWDLRFEKPAEFRAKLADADSIAKMRWGTAYQQHLLMAGRAAAAAGSRGIDPNTGQPIALEVARIALSRAVSVADINAAVRAEVANEQASSRNYGYQISGQARESGDIPEVGTPGQPININEFFTQGQTPVGGGLPPPPGGGVPGWDAAAGTARMYKGKEIRAVGNKWIFQDGSEAK